MLQRHGCQATSKAEESMTFAVTTSLQCSFILRCLAGVRTTSVRSGPSANVFGCPNAPSIRRRLSASSSPSHADGAHPYTTRESWALPFRFRGLIPDRNTWVTRISRLQRDKKTDLSPVQAHSSSSHGEGLRGGDGRRLSAGGWYSFTSARGASRLPARA